jgi:hypothetical protein
MPRHALAFEAEPCWVSHIASAPRSEKKWMGLSRVPRARSSPLMLSTVPFSRLPVVFTCTSVPGWMVSVLP